MYAWLRATRPIRWLCLRGAWLVAIVIGIVTFMIINGTSGNLLGRAVQANYRLVTQGHETSARVSGVGLTHYGCSYTYRVEGRTFSGAESGCGGRRVGSTLRVRYVTSNPEIASIGDPVSEFWEGLVTDYGVPLFFAAFFYFGWKWTYRDMRRCSKLVTGRQ